LPDLPPGTRDALADRYVIERELGQGGMATVYLAHDLRHDREVALKVLRPELAVALGPERFLREITTTAGLRHPNILPLYDSGAAHLSHPDLEPRKGGRSPDLLYYVMPYVEGESLRDRLDRDKQLPVEDALRIAHEIADALSYAHGRGVIHRDIKPENILLERGHAVVADFGIARAVSNSGAERLTQTGLAVGTPAYMSPEQSAGESEVDARTDIYALGCVLYEMLAGEPPYTGVSAQAVMAKRFVDPVPGVRRLRPTVPPAVEQALQKALARVPADRFASCGEFVMALSRPAESPPKTPSVAVLPFLNLSPDPANEFFADGIAEDVIAQLSKIRSLKVISRTSAMRFKQRDQGLREIGATLGVATLVEGSVRRAGDRVRIVAQLIDAEADRHLWAETYDRQLTDIFAIQTDVALQIAAALEAELLPHERARIGREPTANIQAYQFYLQGRYCYSRYTEDNIRKGIEYFEQAVAADPTFALAHAGIAMAYAEITAGQGGGGIRPALAYSRAMDAVTRALASDNELGEAHSALALLKFVHDFDWAGAEAEFKIALELSPGSADAYDHYGWFCGALERYDEALELVTRAQELDPLVHRADVAATLLRAGRNEEALQAALRAVEFEPDYPRARSSLAWAQLKTGQVEEGLANLAHAARIDPHNTIYLAQLGQAYATVGKREKALEVLRQLEEAGQRRYVSPYHMAYVYTGLGEQDRAIDFLERAHAERAGSVYGIRGSFLFSTLRSHPRFQALLRKMNLG
jgi:eukaryotic-like serine/threonine-protein kinase